MKRIILASLFGGMLGVLLALAGFPFTTWQFWVWFAAFMLVDTLKEFV